MPDFYKVVFGSAVEKQLNKLPDYILRKFYAWVTAIELVGVVELRKKPGFHDEPLKGNRRGQRSVRLNKAYRIIYIESKDALIECIEVVEVNKHDY